MELIILIICAIIVAAVTPNKQNNNTNKTRTKGGLSNFEKYDMFNKIRKK